MTPRSSIEWTSSTWNPVTGCDAISPGCDHCYAERMAKRLKAMGVAKYSQGFKPRMHKKVLNAPLKWKKGQIIFVNSMSDLFHDKISEDFIEAVFDVMKRADQHLFQVLTKRPKRLLRLAPKLPWPDNVWMGTTVESKDYRWRIKDLRKVPAKVRFLSLEPLIGPLGTLDLTDIHWAIVGGESGPGARPMDVNWVRDIRKQCAEQGTEFFFKQWGGVNKKRTGRKLDGRYYDNMPEFPNKQLQLI